MKYKLLITYNWLGILKISKKKKKENSTYIQKKTITSTFLIEN